MNRTASTAAYKEKIYFPNLNGLRFLAAFVVVIHHLEQVKYIFGVPNVFFKWPAIHALGDFGVTLFFVLSGFLITYLLLVEKARFGRIDISAFYIRRLLRIWPLYYLIIFLGLAILPHIKALDVPLYSPLLKEDFGIKVILYILLLPNIVTNIFPFTPHIAQTWSIGIEEQFYFIWPFFIQKLRNTWYLLVLTVLIMWGLTIPLSYWADLSQTAPHLGQKFINWLYGFFSLMRIGCMSIGGMGAYVLFHNKTQILNLIYDRKMRFVAYIVLTVLLISGFILPWIHHETLAFFFIILILNLGSCPQQSKPLEHPYWDYLGRMSYSIYMWHFIAIAVVHALLTLWDAHFEHYFTHIVYYLGTFLLTFVFSYLSYEYFEKVFLRYKINFSHIQSGR